MTDLHIDWEFYEDGTIAIDTTFAPDGEYITLPTILHDILWRES